MLSNPKEETEIKVKRTFYCHKRKKLQQNEGAKFFNLWANGWSLDAKLTWINHPLFCNIHFTYYISYIRGFIICVIFLKQPLMFQQIHSVHIMNVILVFV